MDPNRIIQALKGTIDPNLRIAAENELNQVCVCADITFVFCLFIVRCAEGPGDDDLTLKLRLCAPELHARCLSRCGSRLLAFSALALALGAIQRPT